MKYLVVLALILFLASVFPANGQTGSAYTISGIVKDSNGALIVGADVRLLTTGHRSFRTVTNRDGRFEFTGCPSGQYILYASASGFAEVSTGVKLAADTFQEIVLTVGEARYSVTAEIGQTEDVAQIPQPAESFALCR